MRAPSARLFPNTVTFSTLSLNPDSSGDSGGRVFSAGTLLACSVQQAEMVRIVVHDGVESVVTHTLLFPAPPVDTTWSPGTSPTPRTSGACRLEDKFLWQGRNLVALGSTRDEAGRAAMYEVDCEERQ